MKKIALTQCFSFSATHAHAGTLNEASHAHTFTCEVTFYGPLNEEYYLIDFRLLQDFFKTHLCAQLDGANLNTLFKNPTTEAVAVWIFEQVKKTFPALTSVKVAEAPDRWVVYTGE